MRYLKNTFERFMNKELIIKSKGIFNDFFRKDLYGQFDSPKNIILSRGSWRDDVVKLPELFKFCIHHTLVQQWVGYSDSLGHENVFNALDDLANATGEKGYDSENYSLTLGNVATMPIIFKQLKETLPRAKVVTLEPYYPSIIKAVSDSFSEISTISSLENNEQDLFNQLAETCRKDKDNKIILLSNFIGVEGRIFSENFWSQVISLTNEIEGFLVIDEGLWFEGIEYPNEINNDRTIRVVSTSKKYGNPGMKFGFMLGPKQFINTYYEYASTSYGGPPSLLFLSAEFLYQFEHTLVTGDMQGLDRLCQEYRISQECMDDLFKNFEQAIEFNHQTYKKHRAIFLRWISENSDLIRKSHIFQGINFFIEPDINISNYEFFLNLIQSKNVSVLPGICLGDMSDTMCRISILECQGDISEGLQKISTFLKNT